MVIWFVCLIGDSCNPDTVNRSAFVVASAFVAYRMFVVFKDLEKDKP